MRVKGVGTIKVGSLSVNTEHRVLSRHAEVTVVFWEQWAQARQTLLTTR